jgi:hypothetical protein
MVVVLTKCYSPFLYVLGTLVLSGLTHPAIAKTFSVASSQELADVLVSVSGGDTIELKPGIYGDLAIAGRAKLNSPVTITSADRKSRAVINSLTVNGSENLVFDSLVFDYVYKNGDVPHKRTLDLNATNHVTVRNCLFDGDVASKTGIPDDDGFPTGIAMYAGESSNLTVENNKFSKFFRGGVFDTTVGLEVSRNEVVSMRAEGFNFSAVKNVVIEGNHIHDFERSVNSPDHPDMIQFWTKGAPRPATEVLIKDNFLDAGTHPWTQSIFMGNEAVLQDGKGKEMFYRNIRITGNVIRNGHIHGITVDAVDNVVIENNTLLQLNPYAEGKNVEVPHILLTQPSKNVTIRRNVLPRVQREYLTRTAGWNIADNYEAQRDAIGRTNHYLSTFTNALARKSMTLEDLAVLPSSEIAGKGLGSALLEFNTTPRSYGGYIRSRGANGSGTKLELDATGIYGPAGKVPPDQILDVSWEFGDGKTGKGSQTTHIYPASGTYEISATVFLSQGKKLRLFRTVDIGG